MSPTSYDLEPLYSSLANDPDLADLLQMFVDEIPERVERIKLQFGRGQSDELRRTIHQFKGSAGSYGFGSVTPVATRLEQALADEATTDEIGAIVDELVALCLRMRAGNAR